MPVVRLKIDLSDTLGEEAWKRLRVYPEAQAAFFGPEFGSSGCNHPIDSPHRKGEWWGAEVLVADRLLAQYAVSHYLAQDGVLDADIEE